MVTWDKMMVTWVRSMVTWDRNMVTNYCIYLVYTVELILSGFTKSKHFQGQL